MVIKEISMFENNNYCYKHFLPADELCEDYTPDTGPGILMKNCSNCYYFNDRRLKYKPLTKEVTIPEKENKYV